MSTVTKPDNSKNPKPNSVNLTVIVNGSPTDVEANVNAPLHTIIPEALEETGNTGQPPESWRILDAPGNQLDPNRKIEEYQFIGGTKLFLSLKEGVGG